MLKYASLLCKISTGVDLIYTVNIYNLILIMLNIQVLELRARGCSKVSLGIVVAGPPTTESCRISNLNCMICVETSQPFNLYT